MNITIHRNDAGAFFVLHGDKFADGLTYEEMLGLVALIATPANPRAMSWLKTGDEWRDSARDSALRMAGMKTEPADEPEILTASEMSARADAADARVVGDWVPPTIRRSQVDLKVGDVVVTRGGETLRVSRVGEPAFGCYPVTTDDDICYTRTGFCYIDKPDHQRTIVTINTRPIIED